MARKSQDLDKKLILIGQALIQEVGVSGLSLREVARIADVNLGMLSYYFDGKEDFILKALSALYVPFIADLEELNTLHDDKSKTRLEDMLMKMATFSRDNRKLILVLLKDVLSGDPIAQKFIHLHFSKHFKIVQKEIALYLKHHHHSTKNAPKMFRYLISSIGMPNVLLGYQELFLESADADLIETNEEIKLRVKAVLTSLSVFLNPHEI